MHAMKESRKLKYVLRGIVSDYMREILMPKPCAVELAYISTLDSELEPESADKVERGKEIVERIDTYIQDMSVTILHAVPEPKDRYENGRDVNGMTRDEETEMLEALAKKEREKLWCEIVVPYVAGKMLNTLEMVDEAEPGDLDAPADLIKWRTARVCLSILHAYSCK